MSDNLTVFGTDYTGVTGIKATGTGNGTLTYIRPQGTKSISANGTGIDVAAYSTVDVAVQTGIDIPVFTMGSNQSIICDKTYAECYALAHTNFDDEEETFAAVFIWEDSGLTYTYSLQVVAFNSDYVKYVYLADGIPNVDIFYNSDGTITVSPTSSIVTLNATSNGTYYPNTGTAYGEVIVNVPSSSPNLQAKTNIAPTTSSQTITADSGYDGLSSVQINAMPSGTAGTPTATKGTVSNHAISVTPSVTNTTGYITGGTKNGTAVTVSASELVSGTLSITSSGTKDVTNYASASVAAGGATASATKGSVSNHSVTVTPSVTRTAGYVTAGTSNGTAVTVSASELVSGSETKTANGTYDVTNLASLVVAIPIVTYYTSSSNPTSSQGNNNDIWLVTQ